MNVTGNLALRPTEDACVEPSSLVPAQAERRRTRRHKLVIEMPEDLYERIVSICAVRQVPVNQVPVNQVVSEVLERAFPSK